jgi:hypothetical protein
MEEFDGVTCIDTGRQCLARWGIGCSHVVTLIREDGSRVVVGTKSRENIIELHKKYHLDIHEHFLNEKTAAGLAYNQ